MPGCVWKPSPQTQEQALVEALFLTFVAPDEEHALAAGVLVAELSEGLDESALEQAQAAALERYEADAAKRRRAPCTRPSLCVTD